MPRPRDSQETRRFPDVREPVGWADGHLDVRKGSVMTGVRPGDAEGVLTTGMLTEVATVAAVHVQRAALARQPRVARVLSG